MADLTFKVPDTLAGKSIRDIFNPVDPKGASDSWYASQFGLPNDTPLTAGQVLTYKGGADVGSNGYQQTVKAFGTPVDPALTQAEAANAFQIKANAPAISAVGSAITNTQGAYGSAVTQYQSEIPNIQNQYQDILNNITKGVNASYAQRGLSNNSPQLALDTSNAQLPTANQESNSVNQFLNAIAGLQTGGASAVSNLQQVLGGLQSGNPLASLQQGIASAMLPYQQAQASAEAAFNNAQAGYQNTLGQYINIPGVGLYNTQSNSFIANSGLAGIPTSGQAPNGQKYQIVNGQYYIIP